MCLQRPRLPLELERAVFLLLQDEYNVAKYTLVAKRVHTW